MSYRTIKRIVNKTLDDKIELKKKIIASPLTTAPTYYNTSATNRLGLINNLCSAISLNDIDQGITSTTRIGNKIHITSVKLGGFLQPGYTSTAIFPMFTRIMVCKCSTTWIATNVTGGYFTYQRNLYSTVDARSVGLSKVYYDGKFELTMGISNPKPIPKYVKIDDYFNYTTADGESYQDEDVLAIVFYSTAAVDADRPNVTQLNDNQIVTFFKDS